MRKLSPFSGSTQPDSQAFHLQPPTDPKESVSLRTSCLAEEQRLTEPAFARLCSVSGPYRCDRCGWKPPGEGRAGRVECTPAYLLFLGSWSSPEGVTLPCVWSTPVHSWSFEAPGMPPWGQFTTAQVRRRFLTPILLVSFDLPTVSAPDS